MKQVIIKNQEEYSALPQGFEDYTEIIIDATEPIYEIRTVPENAVVTLTGQTVVEYLYITVNVMWGSSQINMMLGSSQVNVMRESSQVNLMRENSKVKEMRGSSQVNVMWESSQINVMWGSSQINEMRGSSQVNLMRESSQVNLMRENSKVNLMRESSQVNVMRENSQVNVMWESSQIKKMRESSKVKEMWGSSQINMMLGSSQVNAAFENVIIKLCSSNVTILRLKHQSTLICQDCNVDIQEKDDTANVIITKTIQHTKQTFLDIYRDNMIDKNNITLYKSVNPDTLCDFYTGKIKYEGTVTCPDWNSNNQLECGSGLHLSPTPELALSHNQGKVLKCKVNIKDFVVYSPNIKKVRCRKIEVIGEVKK